MEVIKSIKDKDAVIGYILDDGGFETVLLSRCLYINLYIEPLIAAGYKYFNYNADDIETPAGQKICELPAVDAGDVMTEDDRFALEELAMNAMTDVECSRYYTYKNESIIQWKEPVSDGVSIIQTREELISYLNEVEAVYVRSGYCVDNIPLNSFVAREALFSLDEIKTNPDIRRLWNICAKRHTFREWSNYSYVVDWLCKQGVLATHNPTYIEFLAAYYSWGIDGIKDDCVRMTTRQAVDGDFNKFTDVADSNNFLSNRRGEYILWDTNGRVHFLKHTEDLSNVQHFDREFITLTGADALFEARQNRGDWGAKYRVLQGMVANVSDRIYLEMLSADGYPYQVRVTHNALTVFSGNYVVEYLKNFGIRSVMSDIILSLEEVQSSRDYYLWNLALIKGQAISKSRSKTVPVSSTYDMLIKEGLSPKAAIRMMAHDIKYNDNDSNQTYIDREGKRSDYFRAFEKYCAPIPESVLEKYGVDPDDYEDTDDFLLKAIDPEAEFDEEGKKKKDATSVFMASLTGDDIDATEYYDNLEFVRACLNNEVSINHLGDGFIEDIAATKYQAAKIILTAMWCECGKDADPYQLEDFIARFEETGAINVNSVFRLRDAAYRGFLVDRAQCRQIRARDCWAWTYCTQIFRECSNAPVDDQRHYLMKVITVTDQNIRTRLAMCVEESVPEDLPTLAKNIATMQSHAIAATLFFAILSGQIGNNQLKDGIFYVDIPITEEHKMQVKIPMNIYQLVRQYNFNQNTRYVTLYDYCQYEYGDNGAFCMYMINASVTPWKVIPKKGYSIPTYNFMANYYTDSVLSQTLGEEYALALKQNSLKPCEALGRLGTEMFIPRDVMGGLDDGMVWDADTIDIFLDETQNETVKMYRERFVQKRKQARAQGLKMQMIALKQDIIYAPLAKYYDVAVPTEAVVYSDDVDDGLCMHTTQRGVVTWKETTAPAIPAVSIVKKQFNTLDYDFSEMYTWTSILNGQFQSPVTIYMNNYSMSVKEGNMFHTFKFASIGKSELDTLADGGIILKLGESKYFVKAFNGEYILEVA